MSYTIAIKLNPTVDFFMATYLSGATFFFHPLKQPLKANTTTSQRTRENIDFTACSATCGTFNVRNEPKLMKIKEKLTANNEDPLKCLKLVDMIHKLGIEYHFQDEIDEFMERHYMTAMRRKVAQSYLFEVSLSFQLLRQQGYYVKTNVFNKFINDKGQFNDQLGQDVKGLMSLYEASHLSVKGEDVLEEAGSFSKLNLSSLISQVYDHEKETIRLVLRYPYHKSLARSITPKYFENVIMADLGGKDARVLQELTKFDSDTVRIVHQMELLEISSWWKKLGLSSELQFARSQPLKWHLWSTASLSNPNFSEQRIELTKPISLIYVIDDIFDVYGTLDELILFTQAVSKWEISATEQLPDYMKLCFKALYDITNEIGYKVYQDYGWNPVASLKKVWVSLINAFLVEAKWFASGTMPSSEEYLKNGIASSGVHVVLVHLFFILGEGRNAESANTVEEFTNISTSVATILRLWDDLGSAKDENQDGKDGSYITYYMNEHKDVSEETARQHVRNMISDAWKRLNKEWLSETRYSRMYKKGCMNLARMVSLMYSYDENQGLPQLEDYMKSVL